MAGFAEELSFGMGTHPQGYFKTTRTVNFGWGKLQSAGFQVITAAIVHNSTPPPSPHGPSSSSLLMVASASLFSSHQSPCLFLFVVIVVVIDVAVVVVVSSSLSPRCRCYRHISLIPSPPPLHFWGFTDFPSKGNFELHGNSTIAIISPGPAFFESLSGCSQGS